MQKPIEPYKVGKLRTLRYFEQHGHQKGIQLIDKHPGFSDTWVIIYRDNNNREFIKSKEGYENAHNYLFSEYASLEQAETICPEALC